MRRGTQVLSKCKCLWPSLGTENLRHYPSPSHKGLWFRRGLTLPEPEGLGPGVKFDGGSFLSLQRRSVESSYLYKLRKRAWRSSAKRGAQDAGVSSGLLAHGDTPGGCSLGARKPSGDGWGGRSARKMTSRWRHQSEASKRGRADNIPNPPRPRAPDPGVTMPENPPPVPCRYKDRPYGPDAGHFPKCAVRAGAGSPDPPQPWPTMPWEARLPSPRRLFSRPRSPAPPGYPPSTPDPSPSTPGPARRSLLSSPRKKGGAPRRLHQSAALLAGEGRGPRPPPITA